jgi:hypothetical protein
VAVDSWVRSRHNQRLMMPSRPVHAIPRRKSYLALRRTRAAWARAAKAHDCGMWDCAQLDVKQPRAQRVLCMLAVLIAGLLAESKDVRGAR